MVCGKKAVHEREIYGRSILKTMLVQSFLVTMLLAIGAEAEYEQIRGGGAKFSWVQGRKVPKYRPDDNS
jgi:hypothetical protein